jgi:chemotaxis methyl-accepting protein methylase
MSIAPIKELSLAEIKQEEIKKIAKRITMLMRDLEAHSLDMVLYSKKISEGKFPVSHLVQVENALTTASTELLRIKNAWAELFKQEVADAKGK